MQNLKNLHKNRVMETLCVSCTFTLQMMRLWDMTVSEKTQLSLELQGPSIHPAQCGARRDASVFC